VSIASNVSLSPVDGGWAAAWRSGEGGFESIVVRVGSDEWRTEPALPGPSGDHPGVIELDGDHMMLVYTVGTSQSGGAPATVGRLRTAVLDRAAPTAVTSAPLATLMPNNQDESLDQRRPAAVRVGDRLFVSWQSESPNGDALRDEVWLQEITWDPADPDRLEPADERPLQVSAPRLGDQRNPTFAASPLFPQGALITLWEDWSGLLENSPTPDVVLGFRPVPFVTLDPPDASIPVN
jgi:hypothetical protein